MNSLKRDYKMSDADLCMFASNIVMFMTRDGIQFTARGITEEMIASFENLGNAFEIFPNDNFYFADYLTAVESKNATRESLRIKLRVIIGFAKIMWGQNSPQVMRFDADFLKRQNDRILLTTCRMAVHVAEDYLAGLSPIGLTEAMINDLEATCQTFEDNLIAIINARSERDNKAQERVQKGNELYSFVVKYCQIGKIIWEDVNEAKYYDYVIHTSPDLPLTKQENENVEI